MFAALISLETLRHALHVIGYPAIAFFVLIECLGIPIPGETMLLLAAFYAANDVQLQVPLVILFAAFGAIMGDNVGYYIGLTGGRRLVERYGRFFFIKMEYLAAAERFFQRHGAKTVFFGRFISLLRIWSAFLAGMNRMNWRTFLIYNGLGGIVWATYNGILGYVAGRYFHEHFDQVEQLASTIGWIGFALVVVIGVGMFLFIRMRLKKFVTESAVEPAAAKREHTQVH